MHIHHVLSHSGKEDLDLLRSPAQASREEGQAEARRATRDILASPASFEIV